MSVSDPISDLNAPARVVIFRMLFKVLVGLLGGVMLADAGVGWLDRDRDLRSRGSMTMDEDLGWVNKPGVKYGKVRISSLGLRSKEIPPNASPNEVRILGVGASRTFGSGVATPTTWAESLERLCTNRFKATSWRVLNGGVKGYSARQAARRAIQLLPQIQPDLVLLFVAPGSQMMLGPSLDSECVTVGDQLAPRDIVESVPGFLQPAVVDVHRWLLNFSLYVRYRAQFLNQDNKQQRVQGFVLSRNPHDEAIEELLQNTLSDFALLIAACSENGVELRAVAMPESFQADRRTWGKYLKTQASRGAPPITTARAEPTEVMVELLEEQGFSIWDVTREVERIGSDFEKYTFDKKHWSSEGHQVIAQGLARRMIDETLIGELVRKRKKNPRQ
jgi:hypothetical protein